MQKHIRVVLLSCSQDQVHQNLTFCISAETVLPPGIRTVAGPEEARALSSDLGPGKTPLKVYRHHCDTHTHKHTLCGLFHTVPVLCHHTDTPVCVVYSFLSVFPLACCFTTLVCSLTLIQVFCCSCFVF